MGTPEGFTYEEIHLKKFMFAFNRVWAERDIEELVKLPPIEVKKRFDKVFREVRLEFSMMVWSHEEGEIDIEYYEDWWQELRVKLLPKWYLRKKPSRKVRIKKEFFSAYPTLLWEQEGKEHTAVLHRIDHLPLPK